MISLEALIERELEIFASPKEKMIVSGNRDESVIDEYFKDGVSKLYMAEVTAQQLLDISMLKEKGFVRRVSKDLLSQAESLQSYCDQHWMHYNDMPGYYSLHKYCLIGSDILRNGQLAPLQMNASVHQDTDSYCFLAHPGSDRTIYMVNLIRQGLIEDRIVIQFEQQPWMPTIEEMLGDRCPELVPVTSTEQLKSYYKNWKDTQLHHLVWDGTRESLNENLYGYMGQWTKNALKTAVKLGHTMTPQCHHIELKALGFRMELRDTIQRFHSEFVDHRDRTDNPKIVCGPVTIDLRFVDPMMTFTADRAW